MDLPIVIDALQPIGGWLIATQTPENHRRIDALLRALREDGNESGILVGGP